MSVVQDIKSVWSMGNRRGCVVGGGDVVGEGVF